MPKTACVIYVESTKNRVQGMVEQLKKAGYEVQSAQLPDADNDNTEPTTEFSSGIAEMVQSADLCLFLFPEDEASDKSLCQAAANASDVGKRVVGICCGYREVAPQEFIVFGDSYIHVDSDNVEAVLNGQECWEKPDKTRCPKVDLIRVKCQ